MKIPRHIKDIRNIKILSYMMAAVAVALLVGGCSRGNASGQRPTLCVSIEPQRKMLEELAGDDYQVVTMLKAGADPETYEPSVSQRMALGEAKAYFIVGTLPFEHKLAASESGVTIFDTSRGIPTVEGTHHGHDGEADPHVWTSLRNSRQMAANMLEALVSLNPDKKAEYATRYAGMAARLDSIDAATSRSLAGAGVRAFAIWHPSLSYYARDYGLHQIAAHAESKEMSPAELTEMIVKARADSVRVFFTEEGLGSHQASVVNAGIGSRIVGINTLDYEWEQQISRITDALTGR